jgi:hypothetical protein
MLASGVRVSAIGSFVFFLDFLELGESPPQLRRAGGHSLTRIKIKRQ